MVVFTGGAINLNIKKPARRLSGSGFGVMRFFRSASLPRTPPDTGGGRRCRGNGGGGHGLPAAQRHADDRGGRADHSVLDCGVKRHNELTNLA